MFANLHTHTDYSVLDGMMTVKTAFSTAKALSYSALAVTEHNNLASMFIAVKESKASEVKYIPGIEFNLKEDPKDDTARHLVVLASDKNGLQSIMNVAYASYGRDVDHPYILWEDLDSLCKTGVFVLSGCCDGLLAVKTLLYGPRTGEAIVDRLATIFGERFLIEVNIPFDDKQNDINLLLTDLSEKKGVRRVLALDSHFKSEDDRYLFNIFLAVQNKGSIYEKDSLFYTRPHLMPEEEIRRAAGMDMADAIDMAGDVASRCDDPREYLKPAQGFMMPKFDIEATSDYDEFLKWKEGRDNG
jgi:DNA polymerase-3 subunit alpha